MLVNLPNRSLIISVDAQSASGSSPVDALSQKLILRMRARFGEAAADVSSAPFMQDAHLLAKARYFH